MWIAIDTTGSWCSVALGVPGEMNFVAEPMHQGHSGRVLSLVSDLLAQRATQLAQVQGIAFGAGPGSFTGLRIACGVAQGLAFGASKPVVAISATDTLSMRWKAAGLPIAVAYDARMGEAYCAVYTADGVLIDGPFVDRPEQAALRIRAALAAAPFLAVGNGFAAGITPIFAALNQLGSEAIACDAQAWPRADWVLVLAQQRFDQASDPAIFDPALAYPLYVRNQVALNIQEQRAFRLAQQS
jgi:tRNA threonylcarbamoyladenosine biosynthesis protein TsaB